MAGLIRNHANIACRSAIHREIERGWTASIYAFNNLNRERRDDD